MNEMDRDRRRQAEEIAGRVIDETDSPDGLAALTEEERAIYVQHLFVHGLLESMADLDRDRAGRERNRRVEAVMARIARAGPTIGTVRRVLRYVAAAAVIALLVFGGLQLFTGGGIEAEAAIGRALDKVKQGLDRHYRAAMSLRVTDGEKRIERRFEGEFITGGTDRFFADFDLPNLLLGKVPIRCGRQGEVFWRDWGMGPARFGRGSRWPGGRFGFGDPRNYMSNLGSLLSFMRRHCRLEMTALEDGMFRIKGTPREDTESPFQWIDHLVMDIDPASYEVKSFAVNLKDDFPFLPLIKRFVNVPQESKLEAFTIRFDHVKSFKAPAEIFLPEELR